MKTNFTSPDSSENSFLGKGYFLQVKKSDRRKLFFDLVKKAFYQKDCSG